MKTLIFVKKSNVRKLHKELVNAGFLVLGITYDGINKTIINLENTETKDPTNIVNAHIFSIDKQINWKNEFANALTQDSKINIFAKKLGIIELTDTEFETGKLQ